MRNGQFISTIIRMQYIPRWSEYAPRFEDSASSHSFRCAALAILIGLAEETLFGRPVDRLRLLGRALWGDLKNTGTGSIKHVTKREALLADYIRTYETQVGQEIVALLSRSLRPFARDCIVEAQDDSAVGRLVAEIDTLDAFLFCDREAAYGSNPFFRDKRDELRRLLLASECESVRWLIGEYDKREGMHEFLGYIVNLDTVTRWNGFYNLIPDNDATHSFRVASLALFNGLLEKERFKRADIDLYKLVARAVLHDLPEQLGGDVITNIKNLSSDVKEAFENYEQDIARAMVAKLPAPLQDALADLMIDGKARGYEGELLDIADKLDALIKSNLEMRNNPSYSDTYYNQLVKIQHRFEHPCVIFFLAYILHDLTYANSMR